MTLIIALANTDQAVCVSDRRLTRDGRLEDDESNKATVFCEDGRVAVAFTGLAQSRSHSTEDWLIETLAEAAKPAAKPDFLLGPTIERFSEMATGRFKRLSGAKRLSVVLVGNHFGDDPPRAYCFLVSNFDRLGREPHATADPTFFAEYLRSPGQRLRMSASFYQSVRQLRYCRLISLHSSGCWLKGVPLRHSLVRPPQRFARQLPPHRLVG